MSTYIYIYIIQCTSSHYYAPSEVLSALDKTDAIISNDLKIIHFSILRLYIELWMDIHSIKRYSALIML